MSGAKGKVLAVSNGKSKDNNNKTSLLSGRRSESAHALNTATEPHSMPPQIPSHPFWWHSRLYSDAMAASMAAAAAAQHSGHMSLGPSEQSSSSTSNKGGSGGGHYMKRNPTNFVPYITDS